ncbi:hypothetical protein N3K66_000242 [Trichothecium roseum]|uniref:Uncharacterized protein n=1 Tax=Trichothecium roseum TaxID=47278 RepID=A0ACC0VE28_9HYPO|nr:hypothetical protein N3K66_000242 [Trichothecium roseum]
MRLASLLFSALLAWQPQVAQAKPVEAEASMSPPLEDHARVLRETLRAAGLVPGPAAALVPEDFAPSTVLNVSFGDKAVELGNLFRVSEVADAPTLGFDAEENAAEGAKYLAMLIDPDAPTPEDPKYAFWRHWIQGGLEPGVWPPAHQAAVTSYLAPGPKDDSTPHRYLFLLFREPPGLTLDQGDVGGEEFEQRRSFKPAELVQSKGLKLVDANWMLGAGDGWSE